eukprot:TRINITY_DN2696_c0_g1_i4.p1 TRINITY_DN2696_c0_g1~~TRINITY_DN2696_c0_g1_i4.p1  ORF type:complete len:421 (+),score=119.90 TRINITY_DN2696_c0_g1_i4:561-1823(+)
METPKLLWLKENLPESWQRTSKYLDLSDFLSYRATGEDVRSLCTVVCKWTYLGHEHKWDETFMKLIGLEELIGQNYVKIGSKVRPAGDSIGSGLCSQSAQEMGLKEGTKVAVGIIDAHAGGIGVLGAVLPADDGDDDDVPVDAEEIEKRIAVISGTSTCHMASSRKPIDVPGVWGPLYSAMIPDFWLSEGGESTTGYLIDHIINSHAASVAMRAKAAQKNMSIYAFLNVCVSELSQKYNLSHHSLLTKNLHILPYFHGNRSPRADPQAVGVISGAKVASDLEVDLILNYYATIQAIAHGTRHIIASMNANGHKISTIFMTGGNSKNDLFVSEHADVTGCRVVLSKEQEAVLLGSAVLGSVAGGIYKTVIEGMKHMCNAGQIILPTKGDNGLVEKYHKAKHDIFLKMYDHEMEYRSIMSDF